MTLTQLTPLTSIFLFSFSILTSTLNAAISPEYNSCFFSLSDSHGITASYNLSLFHLQHETFQVDDDNIDDFRYEFNICGSIPSSIYHSNSSIPSYCRSDAISTSDPCISINTSSSSCLSTFDSIKANLTPTAVQINENAQTCHWLGTELNELDSLSSYSLNNNIDINMNIDDFNITLYDPLDSSSGIRYTIRNGAWCPGIDSNINRELIVELICPDSNRDYFNPDNEILINETVIEYPTCVYTLSYESPLACPHECIVKIDDPNDNINNNGKYIEYTVCNGRGICISDPIAKNVRCICDDGWEGDDCKTKSNGNKIKRKNDGNNGILIALIVCVFLLVGTVIFVIYLNYKVRKEVDNKRKDGRNEEMLAGDGNENINGGSRRDSGSGNNSGNINSGNSGSKIGGTVTASVTKAISKKFGEMKNKVKSGGKDGSGSNGMGDNGNQGIQGQDYVQFDSDAEDSFGLDPNDEQRAAPPPPPPNDPPPETSNAEI